MDEHKDDLFGGNEGVERQHKLPVYRFSYKGYDEQTWPEIFGGFDTLYAVTYSSSINFVDKLLASFSRAEIIIGSEHVMGGDMTEIMAFQTVTLESLYKLNAKKNSNIHAMLKTESVRVWLSNKKMSHEKIYLLHNSSTGSNRVVFGSANMSGNAFYGRQWENICIMDNDDEGFKAYKRRFDELKEDSTDFVAYDKILIARNDEDVDSLPVSETIRAKKVMILEQEPNAKKEGQIIVRTQALAKRFKPLLSVTSKKGRTEIYADAITNLARKLRERKKEDEVLGEQNPEFTFDIQNQTAAFNGKQRELHPYSDAINSDVSLFVDYMNEFSSFYGKTRHLQSEYFKFAVWFFAAPFIPFLRYKAFCCEKSYDPYPVYGLIYGTSKAGKTTFVKTLFKMMFGVIQPSRSSDFTATNVEGLKAAVKGIPLFYDDLSQTTFKQHGDKIIKNDDFGLKEDLDSYPCVVVTGNEDIKAIDQQIARRVVQCHVDAGITTIGVMKNSTAKKIQKKMKTALYDEYFRRMLEKLPTLIKVIEDPNNDDIGDIFVLSSQTLIEVIREHSSPLPDYIKEVSLNDYFDEKQTASAVIERIGELWKNNRKLFKIIKKKNKLQIVFSTHWEAVNIKKSLPVSLEPEVIKETLTVDLAVACEFFEIDFKNRLFGIGI